MCECWIGLWFLGSKRSGPRGLSIFMASMIWISRSLLAASPRVSRSAPKSAWATSYPAHMKWSPSLPMTSLQALRNVLLRGMS